MKILTVGYLHGNGGAERQITLLANNMAQKGHDVHFVILAESNIRYSINENVKVYNLSKEESGNGLVRIIKRYNALKKTTKLIKPDVSIHYWLQSAYFSVLFSRKYRGKVIYSERGDPYDKEFHGILGVLRWLADFKIDGFVFQSEGARDFFSSKIKQRSIVIHNSVNVPTEKYLKPVIRDKRIVNVGRLHPQKNQKLLIDAFAKVSSEFPDYKLEIYGDGDLQNDLQKQINEYGLEEKVAIYPSRKDLWGCIYSASLFVLSSDYEGIPNALLEAMALGLPCISTDCRPGGARTLIEDGKNGFIVPVANVECLSEKMSYVLSHETVADSIAEQARKIAESHTEKVVFDRWEEYLLRIIG
jgi:glycosyltransferase involved in cell wall biosynthesis